MYSKLLVIVAALFTWCICAALNVEKCNRKDDNFNKCLATAIGHVLARSTSSIKEFGLPALEPFQIPALIIPAGSGPVSFEQVYKNFTYLGLSKVKCSKAELNFSDKTLFLNCESPIIQLHFDYEINGKVLLMPISGKGPGFIDLEHLNFQLTFNFEEYKRKGKNHFKVTSQKLILTPQFLRCGLSNLFNGDKTLGDSINQLLNDNWSDLFNDVKPNYEDAFGQIFAGIFNGVLRKLSVSDLFGESV